MREKDTALWINGVWREECSAHCDVILYMALALGVKFICCSHPAQVSGAPRTSVLQKASNAPIVPGKKRQSGVSHARRVSIGSALAPYPPPHPATAPDEPSCSSSTHHRFHLVTFR